MSAGCSWPAYGVPRRILAHLDDIFLEGAFGKSLSRRPA